MKKLLIVFLAAAAAACTSRNENDIVVKVAVENMTLSKVGLLIDRTTGFSIDLDKNGKGSVVIPNLENIYVHVLYGQAAQDVFVQKGEEVTLHFDARDFANTLRVEGKNTAANEYLKTTHFLPGPQAYDLPWAQYDSLLNDRITEMTQLLEARKLEQTLPQFVQVEKGRILYSYSQGLIMYPMAHGMMTGEAAYQAEPALLEAVGKLFVERAELADVEAYREFMIFAAGMLATGNTPTGNAYDRTVTSMKYIATNLADGRVKQTLLRTLALEYIVSNGIRHTEELLNLVNAYVTEPQMLQEIKDEYTRNDLTAPGHPSADFAAHDIDGNIRSLADFRGKYLYIDIWATWCGPCQQQFPYLKQLETKFEGRNITFLGLSTDKDTAAWEAMVRSGKVSGVQLLLGSGSQFQSDYGIENIPRFILLDREGKIVNANMPRPSDEGIERLLNDLEGI